MQIVSNIAELFGTTYELTVGAICPKCQRMLLSTTPEAKKILVFGCQYCGDIESCSLLKIKSSVSQLKTTNDPIKDDNQNSIKII